MSDENQEQESFDGITDNHTDIDKSKRKFSKAGMAVPVIMTLASRPVFAVQGLSNMISGNGSGCQGDSFFGGFSHGFWKNQAGNNAPNGSDVKWRIATSTTGQSYESVTVSQAFAGHTLPPGTVGNDTLLSVIRSNINPKCQIVAGYLNLFYYLNNGNPAENYFLTVPQFWALNDGDTTTWDITKITDSTGAQLFVDFADLIQSNMDLVPGSVCAVVGP